MMGETGARGRAGETQRQRKDDEIVATRRVRTRANLRIQTLIHRRRSLVVDDDDAKRKRDADAANETKTKTRNGEGIDDAIDRDRATPTEIETETETVATETDRLDDRHDDLH